MTQKKTTADNKYFDENMDKWAVKILPGEVYASHEDEVIIATTLRCVVVCLYNKTTKTGGVTQFMLPPVAPHIALAYGRGQLDVLMDNLNAFKAERTQLEARIYGAAEVEYDGDNIVPIGPKLIEVAEKYFKEKNITVTEADVAKEMARKVYFTPTTGSTMMKKINRLKNKTLHKREKEYCTNLLKKFGDA